MVGPVLWLEMLLGGRRGRQLIFRYLYAGWLILQLSFFWLIYWFQYQLLGQPNGFQAVDPNLTSRFATGFVELIVVQQFILIVLVTPAFSAGAITDEKTRGTLQHLLTAHLTAGEIVVGKLLARMAQVGLLLGAGLPVLCFIGVFGGMHPLMMFAVFAVTIAPIYALGAASLLASVWCRQTRDAVLGLYAVGGALLLLAWASGRLAAHLSAALPVGAAPGLFLSLLLGLDRLLDFFSPIWVLEAGWTIGDTTTLLRRLVISVLAWGSIGTACLGLATWRLRAAYIRQLESSGKKPHSGQAHNRRVPVGDEPIRWKEREVDGIAPLVPLRRIPSKVGMALVFCLTVLSSVGLLCLSLNAAVSFGTAWRKLQSADLRGLAALIDHSEAGPLFLLQSLGALLLASLVVGIRCSGTVSGEREKQTWEALLLTPLETKYLIRGKLWGILGAAIPFLLAYALPALLLALLGGLPAFFWTMLFLGVTLLAMFYVGAAGVFCSVRSHSSWRSLLGTLGFGYLGGFLLFVVTSPFTLIIAFILYLILGLIDNVYQLGLMQAIGPFGDFLATFFIGVCIGMAAAFYGSAWLFISSAEKRVADRERTRHWKDEPKFRLQHRPLAAARSY